MRAKYQVLIIPFKREKEIIKYGIFKREDMGVYQAVSGGGEDGETVMESAKREFFEETGLRKDNFILLDSISSVPACCFSASKVWGPKTYVVREYAFGVEISRTDKILLSDEHSSFKFINYEKALKKLKWDSNVTALYELNERIKNDDLY